MSTSITGELGYSVRIYIDAVNAIGGETTISYGVSTNMIPMDTKDNTAWTEVTSGRKTLSCSASGLIDVGDAGYGVVQTKSFNGTTTTVEIKTFNGTRQYSFSAYVSEFTHDGPHDGPLAWSCTLTQSGAVIEEAA